MKRRDFVKGAPVLVAAAAIPQMAQASSKARVCWLVKCSSGDAPIESLPDAATYCAQQRAKGREIVATLVRAGDLTSVIVGETHAHNGAAQERARQIVDSCYDHRSDAAAADFGELSAVTFIEAGEAVDVVGLLIGHETKREVESMRRELAQLRHRWRTVGDPRPHHPGAD